MELEMPPTPGIHSSELFFHCFYWGRGELSSTVLSLGARYVVIDEFCELYCSAGSQDAMNLPDELVPGPSNCRLHITDMHKIEVIVLERYPLFDVKKLCRQYLEWSESSSTTNVQFDG